MGCKPIFLHFHPLFLSHPFFLPKKLSSLSVLSHLLLRWRRVMAGGPTRRLAAIDGAAAATNTPFFNFLYFSPSLLHLFLFLTLKFLNKHLKFLDLQVHGKKREGRKTIYLS